MSSQDDADLDDDGLKGLRSMWLSLPDEEPSSRGLDALMAAARVKAEEMAQPSLWERFVAMMRRPQVLALATIMLLIGGGLFISQRSDKFEASQPSSASETQQLERARDLAPAAQTVSTGSSPIEEADGRGGGAGSGSAKAIRGLPGEDKGALEAQPVPSAVRPADAEIPKRPLAKKAAPSGAATGGSKAVMKPKPEPKSGMAAGGATSGTLIVDDLEDSPKLKAAEEAKPDVQEPTVKQLHTQARAAAARNDCTAVKALAKKIAAKDAPYYRANIAPDAALAACLN